MEKQDIVRALKYQKIYGIDTNDEAKVNTANKGISSLIAEYKETAKKCLPTDNKFKSHIINNMKNIKKNNSININVDTVPQALDKLEQIDFRHLFGIDAEIGETFIDDFYNSAGTISFVSKSEEESMIILKKEYSNLNCDVERYLRMGYYVTNILIRGEKNTATVIYSSDREKYLYLIKYNYPYKEYHYEMSFNIVDLYEIVMHCNLITAIQKLCEIFNISIKNDKQIKSMYKENIIFIKNNIKKDVYPKLQELIGEHLPKLIALLEEGADKSLMHIKIGEKVCFSCSLSYLAEELEKRKSTLCPIINTFVLLGFIGKVPNNKKKIITRNIERNDITYFSIVKYTIEQMGKAENIASVMLKNGVRASQLKYKNCKELFGEQISDNIYIADLNKR